MPHWAPAILAPRKMPVGKGTMYNDDACITLFSFIELVLNCRHVTVQLAAVAAYMILHGRIHRGKPYHEDADTASVINLMFSKLA